MKGWPLKKTDVIIREEDGKILALNQDQKLLLVMNSSGFFIWDRCDGQHSAEDIAEGVRQSYELAGSSVGETDVNDCIEQYLSVLEKGKLVTFAADRQEDTALNS